MFTVLSSLPTEESRLQMASEVERVLRSSGAVLFYDVRRPNPGNPDLFPIGNRQVRKLFPTLEGHLQTITVLPPLARRLGIANAVLYPALARVPVLTTHTAGVLVRR